jgi:hypothetical protein
MDIIQVAEVILSIDFMMISHSVLNAGMDVFPF